MRLADLAATLRHDGCSHITGYLDSPDCTRCKIDAALAELRAQVTAKRYEAKSQAKIAGLDEGRYWAQIGMSKAYDAVLALFTSP